jgi:hypothetical protein
MTAIMAAISGATILGAILSAIHAACRRPAQTEGDPS